MLTRELLNFRRVGGKLSVKFIAPDAARPLELADSLLSLHRLGVQEHWTRAELDSRLEPLLKGAWDVRLGAGLDKLLRDHGGFNTASDAALLPEARRRLFTAAGKMLAAPPADYAEFRRRLEAADEFAAGDIYRDLPEFETMTSAPEWSARELLERYNVALVQGMLLYAKALVFTLPEITAAELRGWMRQLKFQRLLAEIKLKPPVTVTVSGPFSLFAETRKYALRLAAFFPVAIQLKAWRLTAELELGEGKPERFSLDSEQAALVSHLRRAASYVPEEFAMFYELFRKSVADWRIVKDAARLSDGAGGAIFPDFSFRRAADSTLVHLEIFHRWHAGALEKRRDRLAAQPELPLILAVDRALADEKTLAAWQKEFPALNGKVLLFRDFPGVERVRKVLDQFPKRSS